MPEPAPASLADADGVRDAAALFLAGHPYRALHQVLPILLATPHPAVRRFAWGLVEAVVVRLEKHPLPAQRHLDSFGRIWRRYRAEAATLGDLEVVALIDRGLAASRVYDRATMPPPAGLSLLWVTPTLEASEFAYAQLLASRLLAGLWFGSFDHLDDTFAFLQSTPIPNARTTALTLIGLSVSRLEARPGAERRDEQDLLRLFTHWRSELANDPAAVALCDRALAAIRPHIALEASHV